MVELVEEKKDIKKRPLKKATLKNVGIKDICTGSNGLRMQCPDTDYISLGGICSSINPDSELYEFMQDLRLSDIVEITIKKVRR